MSWLALLLLACDGAPVDSEGDDSAADTGDPACESPVPYDVMVDEYPAAMCAYDATCDEPFFPDEASCRQLYSEDATEVNYDACKARECLDAFGNLPPCESTLELPEACVGMLAGGGG